MSVIIRREGQQGRRTGGRWLVTTLAIGGLCAGVAMLGVAWRAGGPQPVREISVAVPVPAGAGQ